MGDARRQEAGRRAATAIVGLALLTTCSGTDGASTNGAATLASATTTDVASEGPSLVDTTVPVPPSSTTTSAPADIADRYPDIVAVDASIADDGTWSFAVTISSPYDTPEQYADGWRVVGPDGSQYGAHTLTHDHASEQPFTRTQRGVDIPAAVTEVTIEGRDLINGFGGTTLTVDLSEIRASFLNANESDQ